MFRGKTLPQPRLRRAPAPRREGGRVVSFWRRHAGILAVTAIGAALILTNLGGTCLWADEGDMAVLARSILVNGVPSAWDGVTFHESDAGLRLNDSLVQVVHPWIPYYLSAASIAVLGESSLAARLPFAIAGILTLPAVYVLMLRLGFERRTACLAAILVVCSVQFLLYARQARHYPLGMVLS